MILTKAVFFERRDVSRETLEKLESFRILLERWNPAINLISKATIPHIWNRHILDSVQVFDLGTPYPRNWLDIGSGAGFPGVVVAILAAQIAPAMHVTLVEADKRKAAFLRTVSRELGVQFEVVTERIEAMPPTNSSIVSARAFARLAELLGVAQKHLCDGGAAIFPKGETVQEEIKEALRAWQFKYELHQSQTNEAGFVLKIGDIARV